MNITFLTHHFQPPDEPGAPRPWKVATYLRDQGHEVTVITSSVQYMTGDRSTSDWHLWRTHERNGLTVIETTALEDYRRSFLRRLVNYLLFAVAALFAGLRTRSPDLVLSGSGIPPFITATSYLIARLRGATFVIEDRDLHPDAAAALGYVSSQLLLSCWEWYHVFFRRRADHIIAVTPGIERHLLDRRIPAVDIDVIPNGYEDDFAPDFGDLTPAEIFERYNLEGRSVVLYTGGFGPMNSLDTLVAAARILGKRDDIAFLLVGAGERRERYVEYCETHELDNVVFVDAQPRHEMPTFYEVANVCVYLTPKGEVWSGMLGNKVFDYLGNGVPLVFAGFGDTAEIVRAADAGVVVEPEDPQALADGIRSVLDDSQRAVEMGHNAREYIANNYDRKTLLAEYESVLHKVVEETWSRS